MQEDARRRSLHSLRSEMADLVKLGRFLLAKPDSELSEGDCSFYDKDGNGKLNVFDLIILRQYATGMIGQTAAS